MMDVSNMVPNPRYEQNRVLLGHTLETCEEFYVDATELITGRTLVTSVSGYGKSYLIRLIVERTAGKCLIGIIDVEGEFASLREKFKFFLIIGQDVPIQLETAEFMAEKVLEEGLSFIIDLSLIDTEMGKQYVKLFYNRLIQLETVQRKPLLTIVEEGDEFGPQGGTASQTCLETIKNLAKKGRKRGMGVIISTQRPAFVSKNVLSQCTKLKLIGRIEWESDLDTLKDFLQVAPTILRHPRDKGGKVIEDGKPHVDSLQPGEFYISGSIVKEPKFVKIDTVTTTHLGGNVQAQAIPAPSELKKTIENLNAALPKILEKIKPSLPNIVQITAEIEKKATARFEEKLKRDAATIETKYKDKIAVLEDDKRTMQKRIDSLGQQASLTMFSPISNVLEHPIVKNNLEKLAKHDERAKNLLMRVQRDTEAERYPTREDLAAFISASKDTVKNLIEIINDTFHATVILGEGSPIHYQSMLQRLYITDVARREIERIEELQTVKNNLESRNRDLEVRKRDLEIEVTNLRNQLKAYSSPEAVTTLRAELMELREKIKVMVTPEAAQALKNKMFELEAIVKETAKKFAVGERERAYFERNFKILSDLFDEVEKGYQKIQADKKNAEIGVRTPKLEETKKEVPTETVEQHYDFDEKATKPDADHYRVLNFLRSRSQTRFKIAEVALMLNLLEQKVCEACHVFSDTVEGIDVTEEGLKFERRQK